MEHWRKAYEWLRAILAILGGLGCLMVLLLLLAFYRSSYPPAPISARSTPEDPLIAASSLLNEAGVERANQTLEVVGYNPGEWRESDRSSVELYCLHAPGLGSDPRWLEAREMQLVFVLAARDTLNAAHAVHDCMPDWPVVAARGMAIQPLQFAWSQGQLGYARLALYDRERQMLYLVSRITPTSPRRRKPVPRPVPSTG
jgi:hypothetical protein